MAMEEQVVEVTIPDGILPGEVFLVDNEGFQFDVLCPVGCVPGDIVTVTPPEQAPVAVEAVVPAGLQAGDVFLVDHAEQTFEVTVPDGCMEGDLVQVQPPPPLSSTSSRQGLIASGTGSRATSRRGSENQSATARATSRRSSENQSATANDTQARSSTGSSQYSSGTGSGTSGPSSLVPAEDDPTGKRKGKDLTQSLSFVANTNSVFVEEAVAPQTNVEAAKNLKLGLADAALVLAAKELHLLLRAIPTSLLHRGPDLDHALRRYETIWLPLLAKAPEGVLLVPPRDVHWVWLVHLLAPEHYLEDVPTRLRRPTSALQRGVLSEAAALKRAAAGLLYTEAEYAASEKAWNDASAGEPYHRAVGLASGAECPRFASAFKYDIAAAVERQRVFNYQVSLPHFADLGFLRRAVLRYKMLLLLKQRHPDRFLVPCYDNVSGAAHQTRGARRSSPTTAQQPKAQRHSPIDVSFAGSRVARTSAAAELRGRHGRAAWQDAQPR